MFKSDGSCCQSGLYNLYNIPRITIILYFVGQNENQHFSKTNQLNLGSTYDLKLIRTAYRK